MAVPSCMDSSAASYGSLEQIHKIAEKAVQAHAVRDGDGDIALFRVDPKRCLPDPLNRDSQLLSSLNVHTLLARIIRAGFSLLKVKDGIFLDIDAARMPLVLENCKSMCSGEDKLAPADEENDPPFHTVLHTNHFTTICRCFLYRTKTTPEVEQLKLTDKDGRLSMIQLQLVDKGFHDYIVAGHRGIRLKKSLTQFPNLIEAIQSSSNLDLVMGETEAQLLSRACKILAEMKETIEEEVGCAQAVKRLQEQMPGLHYFATPMTLICARIGRTPKWPFIPDLLLFHAEHVHATKHRSEPDFWQALTGVAPECAWAIVALAKDNWAADRVKGGVCRGVPTSYIKNLTLSGGSKLRTIHDSLHAWRTKEKTNLSVLPPRVQARVLAFLDVSMSRVVRLGSLEVSDPREDSSEGGLVSDDADNKDGAKKEVKQLKLESPSDVLLLSTYTLYKAVACQVDSNGNKAQQCVNLPSLSEFDARAASEKLKKRTCGGNGGKDVSPGFVPDFNEEGKLQNWRASLKSRGVVEGSEVTATESCILGRLKIAKRESGTITEVKENTITVAFKQVGAKTIDWRDFNFDKLVVTKYPSNFVETPLTLPCNFDIESTTTSKRVDAKAQVIVGLKFRSQVLAENKKIQTDKDISCEVLLLGPKRGVCLLEDVSLEKPLFIIPRTTNIGLCDFEKEAFLRTKVEVVHPDGKEVVVMGSVFSDPRDINTSADDTKQKDKVVELFWVIPRSKYKEECNLILVDAEVVIGGGVSVSGVGCVPSSTKVRIPVMKPLDGLECLEKQTQLKCFYKPEGIDPVKKAKLS